MTKQIKMVFDQNGQVTVDAIGYQGTTCKDATKVFVEAFSGKKSNNDKPELYQQPTGVGVKQETRW